MSLPPRPRQAVRLPLIQASEKLVTIIANHREIHNAPIAHQASSTGVQDDSIPKNDQQRPIFFHIAVAHLKVGDEPVVPGAGSPMTNVFEARQKFFRLGPPGP